MGTYLEVADPELVLVGRVEHVNFELVAVVPNVRGVPSVVPYMVSTRFTVAAVQGSVC